MKITLKISALLLTLILLISCRSEDREILRPSEENSLKANTNAAALVLNTSLNDGSYDNIIDRANCFSIKTPFTVVINGVEITVLNEESLDTAEDILDEFDDDTDNIEIQFPITIIQSDFTQIIVTDATQFESLVDSCPGENETDDDIECVDFQYPIIGTLFNNNNDLIGEITINNDSDLYNFVEDLDVDIFVSLDFPITLILSNQTEVVVTTIQQLESVIEDAKDDCDEDDDYDYNDDDCNNCTTTQLSDILSGCNNWIVDKLERNDDDLEDNYAGFIFNFSIDGSILVTNGMDSYNGTWESNGSGNSISVAINITGLTDFNAIWFLHEIQQETSETNVDLRIGDDRLRFESNCQ